MIVLNRTVLSLGRRSTVGGRTLFFRALFTLAALASSLYPRVASAGLVIEVENASALAGGTGSFDVVLAATSGTFDVSAFSVELSVAAGSGVTFTGASVDTTTAPYLFTTLQEPPLTFNTFPTNDFTASDSDMTLPGFVTLSGPPTTTLGLENVTFAVAPGTPAGPISVAIVIGNNTQILDLTGDVLPATTVDGTITIGASAVPEPSSLIMGLSSVGLISGVVVMKRRRR